MELFRPRCFIYKFHAHVVPHYNIHYPFIHTAYVGTKVLEHIYKLNNNNQSSATH